MCTYKAFYAAYLTTHTCTSRTSFQMKDTCNDGKEKGKVLVQKYLMKTELLKQISGMQFMYV